MTSSFYQFYRSNTIALCSTLVVKHSEVAAAMNADVSLRLMPRAPSNTPNPNFPATWKYYMNLAGQYHALDKQDIRAINIALGYPKPGTGGNYTLDEMLVFVSGDTGPVLANFNTTTVDVSLANEYRYGTSFYKELISRYPDHEHLILGILNPVDIAVAIAAKDGDILYCGGFYRTQVTDSQGTRIAYIQRDQTGVIDNGQIESNETNLIEKIQTWITGTLVRWHNRDYAKTDDLYMGVFLGNLMLNLPMVVMNARLENCLTPMAHSYHVREYLESHGQLAKYIPALPLEQTLFLYRNVRWIQANAGKQETFQLLINRLANPAKVPLSGFRLRHKVSAMPTELLPETVAEREVINFRSILDDQSQIPVTRILELESQLAVNNPKTDQDIAETAAQVQLASVTNAGDAYETKLIQSTMADMGDRFPFKLSEILFNHWLYCASSGKYKGTVYYTHPVTGDRLHITPRNAAIVFLYALAKTAGITLTTVPTYRARLIPKSPDFVPEAPFGLKPTLTDLKRLVDPSRVSDEELADIIGTVQETYTFTNTNDFYLACQVIHQQLMRRYYVSVGKGSTERQSRLENVGAESFLGRAMLERCLDAMYWGGVPCHLADGIEYAAWFHDTGVDMSPIESLPDSKQPTAYAELAAELLKQATGGRISSTVALKELQDAVMGILRQFSSYSIQYVHSISNWDTLLVDPKPVRIQYKRTAPSTRFHISVGRSGVLDVRAAPPNLALSQYNAGLVPNVSSTVTPPWHL